MRIYNKFIVALVLASTVINTWLALLGQNNLQTYLVLNMIVYLIITLLFVYLNPKARRALNTVGVVLFAGFMVIVGFKVMSILTK